MVKKFISVLDSSKTSGHNSILVIVLKNQLISSSVLHTPVQVQICTSSSVAEAEATKHIKNNLCHIWKYHLFDPKLLCQT